MLPTVHEAAYGAVVTGGPSGSPSKMYCTDATVAGAEAVAVAERVTVPEHLRTGGGAGQRDVGGTVAGLSGTGP